jgi:hypothetical protein
MFSLKFETENAAFGDEPGELEVVRILRLVAERVGFGFEGGEGLRHKWQHNRRMEFRTSRGG